ncbi:hypothetical protein GF360_00435 [candidate division WWE3 bacterium]|nr:hypothetical protein [candidate division WWE3 bacterium]
MYIPEYTITNKTLQNITVIEYLKAVAETKVILPSWEKNLKKEAQVQFIKNNLNLLGIRTDVKEIKKYLDGLVKKPAELVENIKKSMDYVQILVQSPEIGEEDLRVLYGILLGQVLEGGTQDTPAKVTKMYRETPVENKPNPEELLAETVGLFDWLNSLDGRETHPLIKAAIVKARFTQLMPLKNYNELMGNLLAFYVLSTGKYGIKNFAHLEVAYAEDAAGYREAQKDLAITWTVRENSAETPENLDAGTVPEEEDLTPWIDFYISAMASKAASIKEEILLLSKDTKIATATGRAKLSKRQERIIRYLQDYGMLQNKDFGRLFPEISEDTVLRELKKLIKKDLVVKRGRTKSSRYELKQEGL